MPQSAWRLDSQLDTMGFYLASKKRYVGEYEHARRDYLETTEETCDD